MWLMTPDGFYSIVKKANEKGLQVRARCREDLDNLRKRWCPKLGPTIHTPDGDYHYRALVSAKEWGRAMEKIGEGVGYDNFKQAVKLRQGSERANLYSRVWAILLALHHRDGFTAAPVALVRRD